MSGVKKIVMPVRGGYSVSLYSWMQSVTNQLNANTEAIALLLDEGLPQRVEQLEKEARTHMYWTPSEIEAAKRKADELIAFFNSKGDTAQGAKILPEHAHRMEQEGRWVCDICGVVSWRDVGVIKRGNYHTIKAGATHHVKFIPISCAPV